MNNSLLEKRNEFDRYKDIKSVCLYGDDSILLEADFTIIMPIYQHPDYLEEALDSALNQNYRGKYAILIVDNDPTGKTGSLEIVKKKKSDKIVFFRNESNIGVAGNWNRGVELAKSKYITFLHDDDTICCDTLQILVNYEKETGSDIAILPMMNLIDEESRVIKKTDKTRGLERLRLLDALTINSYGNGEAALLPRQQVMDIGGFPESFYPCLDYAFFIKLLYYYGAVRCFDGLLNYRIAANYQIKGWKTLCECDERVRLEFSKIVRLPNSLLRFLIRKQKEVRLARACEQYGPNEDGIIYSASKIEKGIVLLYEKFILALRCFPGIVKYNR